MQLEAPQLTTTTLPMKPLEPRQAQQRLPDLQPVDLDEERVISTPPL